MRKTAGIAAAAALTALLAAAAPARAEDKCTLQIMASFDMMLAPDGRIAVPVSIGGKPFRMLLDTGGYSSVVKYRVANLLKQPIDVSYNGAIMMLGGMVNTYVDVSDFQIGQMRAPTAQFAAIPDVSIGPGVDGLLGNDYLSFFDVEFDFANGKLNLIKPEDCNGNVVYWTHEAYAQIPFDLKRRHISVDAQLDGKLIEAIVDTGSAGSGMDINVAADLFNLDKTAEAKSASHTFKELSLGGVAVFKPRIRWLPGNVHGTVGGGARMILGMDVLRHLHLYVAYKDGKLYVTGANAH